MNRFMGFVANLALLAGSLLFTIVVCEVLLRTFGNQDAFTTGLSPSEMIDRNSPTHLRAGFSGAYKTSEISGKIHINSKGLRDQERSYGPSEKFRILALGDSFTFGHGVDAQHSYISMLNNLLQTTLGDNHIEVINAGVPGIGPQMYLQILETEGLKYAPDLILINFFVGNDVYDTQLETVAPTQKQNDLKSNHYSNSTMKAFRQVKGILREHVHLYSFIVDRLKSAPMIRSFLQEMNIAPGLLGDHVIHVLEKDYDSLYEAKWNEVLKILSRIHAKGIPTVLVIIPSREQVDDERRSRALRQLGYKDEEIDIFHPNMILKTHTNKLGMGLIDLLPVFKAEALDRQLYFTVDPHFNLDGNLLAAKTVAEELLRQKYVKRQSSQTFSHMKYRETAPLKAWQ